MNSLRAQLAPVLFLAGVAALPVLLGSATSAASSEPPTNPLVNAALAIDEQFSFEGEITERIDTGDYRYMRVNETWVVSLAMTSPTEGRVRVTAVGRASEFTSRRLGRRFDVLVFGVVRAAASQGAAAESEMP